MRNWKALAVWPLVALILVVVVRVVSLKGMREPMGEPPLYSFHAFRPAPAPTRGTMMADSIASDDPAQVKRLLKQGHQPERAYDPH